MLIPAVVCSDVLILMILSFLQPTDGMKAHARNTANVFEKEDVNFFRYIWAGNPVRSLYRDAAPEPGDRQSKGH